MRRSLLVFVIACGVLVGACGGTATTGQGDDTSDARAPGAPPSAIEATALDFTAPAVDGGTVHGADYAGDALAIWFWAPW
ncbi:MAG TPA: hypothetical protein VFW06_01040 [Acidimicrobiia bacterium]|nr:hypothetical protein [Acidimicrobiia bacterium]